MSSTTASPPRPPRARQPRAGLTRGNGARQIKISSDRTSRDMMQTQRRTLNRMADRSLRHIPKPPMRQDSMDIDEMTLHVLCSTVSELMGGPPAFVDDNPPLPTLQEKRSSDFDISSVDADLQRQELARLESLQLEELEAVTEEEEEEEPVEKPTEEPTQVAPAAEPTTESTELNGSRTSEIEVAPGLTLPLYGSKETWQAMLEGRIVVTQCLSCTEELSCVEGASLVVCFDCWVFSPVGMEEVEISDEGDASEKQFVGMGIKASEMRDWLLSAQNGD